MLTAKDIMSKNIVSISPESEITQAAKILLEERVNGLPVIDDGGNLVGILCQSDLIAQQKKISLPSLFTLLDGFIPLQSSKQLDREFEKISAISVGKAMTPNPVTVSPDATLEDVATLMVNQNFHTLPVIENGKLVGIIGKEDVLRTLIS